MSILGWLHQLLVQLPPPPTKIGLMDNSLMYFIGTIRKINDIMDLIEMTNIKQQSSKFCEWSVWCNSPMKFVQLHQEHILMGKKSYKVLINTCKPYRLFSNWNLPLIDNFQNLYNSIRMFVARRNSSRILCSWFWCLLHL